MNLDTTQIVHLGYGLMLCALLARDVLWLRGILVVAQSTLTAYGWAIDRPSMAAWNALFVVINTVWVLRIIQERRAVRLPEELRAIHERRFAAFTAPEFLRFWQRAEERELPAGRIVSRGQKPPHLLFLLEGEVRVLRGNRVLATLRPGDFIGEMSLMIDSTASADVEAATPVRVRAWRTPALREVRIRQPLLWSKLQSAIGHDMVEKLQREPLEAAEPPAETSLPSAGGAARTQRSGNPVDTVA